MKKQLFTLIILFLSITLSSQTYLEENFSDNQMPPEGWTLSQNPNNWNVVFSANSGGLPPEAKLSWQPNFNGYSRMVSPEIDLTGVFDLAFQFKHSLRHQYGDYIIGIATRSAGGNWNIVWAITNPTAYIHREFVNVIIDNGDVGADDFQLSVFMQGISSQIADWFIDDLKLYTPFTHDVAALSFAGKEHYSLNETADLKAVFWNAGLESESFDVLCEMYVGDELIFSDTKTISDLGQNEQIEVDFNAVQLMEENTAYKLVFKSLLPIDENPDNDELVTYINTYSNLKEMVVMELFTATSCGWCSYAAVGVDELISNGHNVAVMEYHSGDEYDNPSALYRFDYYGIMVIPTAIFEGTVFQVGGISGPSYYDDYLPIYEERMEIGTAFDLGILATDITNDQYSVQVSIDKLAPAYYENLVLHVVLTESHIPESWGYGMVELNFVERLMLPDEFGTSVDMIVNDIVEIPFTFTVDNTWATDNCELVAFVQNVETREILNGTKVMLNDLQWVGDNEIVVQKNISLLVYPNPFHSSTTIQYSIPNDTKLVRMDNQLSASRDEIIIYDHYGRIIRALPTVNNRQAVNTITWDGKDQSGNTVPSGLYNIVVLSNGRKVGEERCLKIN